MFESENEAKFIKLKKIGFYNRRNMPIHKHIRLQNYTKAFCSIAKTNNTKFMINTNKNFDTILITQEIFSLVRIYRQFMSYNPGKNLYSKMQKLKKLNKLIRKKKVKKI